jgi:hypothetical protein
MNPEEFQMASDIYAYLLKNRELESKDDPEMYHAYIENDRVQKAVKTLGRSANFEIALYGHVIYLIPDLENTTFGYTNGDLRGKLVTSKATPELFNLANFVILVFLVECYDSQGETSNNREFMKEELLEEMVEKYLKEGMAAYTIEQEEAMGIGFHALHQSYNALSASEGTVKGSGTKEGFITRILRFLDAQGLVDYIKEDHMIKILPRLTAFMDSNLLNKARYDRVNKMFETLGERGEDNE